MDRDELFNRIRGIQQFFWYFYDNKEELPLTDEEKQEFLFVKNRIDHIEKHWNQRTKELWNTLKEI